MKFGIIGLGAHGITHANVLTRLGQTVIGVDANSEARAEFGETFDAKTYKNTASLYEQDIAGIIIATPNKFHEATATEALDAGFPTLIEKPLAHDLPSAERIVEVADQTGCPCLVSFSNKFQTACSVAKSYVESGYFGKITHIRARHVRRRGIPGRGTWYTSKDIAGGGALLDIGANLVNVLLYLTGWPTITEVVGNARSEFGKQDNYAYLDMYDDNGQAKMYDVEDSVTAFCKFGDGMTASIEVAWAANAQPEHKYVIQGTDAGAELRLSNDLSEKNESPLTNELSLLETRPDDIDHHVDAAVTVPDSDPLEREMRHFIAAATDEEHPTLNSVQQGLRVQRAIDTIYTASR
jgi:predicted dehydrogenase